MNGNQYLQRLISCRQRFRCSALLGFTRVPGVQRLYPNRENWQAATGSFHDWSPRLDRHRPPAGPSRWRCFPPTLPDARTSILFHLSRTQGTGLSPTGPSESRIPETGTPTARNSHSLCCLWLSFWQVVPRKTKPWPRSSGVPFYFTSCRCIFIRLIHWVMEEYHRQRCEEGDGVGGWRAGRRASCKIQL